SGRNGPSLRAGHSRHADPLSTIARAVCGWRMKGDWNWGKDYGQLIPESGRGLLSRRHVRLAVREDGRWQQSAAPLRDSVPGDFRQVFLEPKVVLDANDNPVVLFRTRVNTPRDQGNGAFRAMWRMFGVNVQQGRWGKAFEFPQGYGRIDMAAAAVTRRDGSV